MQCSPRFPRAQKADHPSLDSIHMFILPCESIFLKGRRDGNSSGRGYEWIRRNNRRRDVVGWGTGETGSGGDRSGKRGRGSRPNSIEPGAVGTYASLRRSLGDVKSCSIRGADHSFGAGGKKGISNSRSFSRSLNSHPNLFKPLIEHLIQHRIDST